MARLGINRAKKPERIFSSKNCCLPRHPYIILQAASFCYVSNIQRWTPWNWHLVPWLAIVQCLCKAVQAAIVQSKSNVTLIVSLMFVILRYYMDVRTDLGTLVQR